MRLLLAAAIAALSLNAFSQELQDPWIPPHLKKSKAASETQGAPLQTQVTKKLQAGFDAADTTGSGAITKEQAKAAGLGYVEQNFEAIDKRRAGAVRFEDVKTYLQGRGAALD